MGKKFYKTLIRKDHILGENLYVIGRVSGIGFMLCGKDGTYAHMKNDKGEILVHYCTLRQYRKFENVIRKHYPDLCKFYYKLEI